MEKFNRQEQLKQLHAERKVKTEKKVDKAINDLVQKNKEINFNIVSKHSKVSKATLYKNNKNPSINKVNLKVGLNPTKVGVL